MAKTEWKGDLADDCTLERYGMLAHVERMDAKVWWFAISGGTGEPGTPDLYNTANNMAAICLTSGDMARAAAECCMEVLQQVVRG